MSAFAILCFVISWSYYMFVVDATFMNRGPGDSTESHSRATSAEKKLTKHLAEMYKQIGGGGRPVLNGSNPTLVRFGLGLIHLELDERDKIMISSLWIKMRWQDEYLQWKPDDWGGVDHVRFDASDIWIPDVMLINTADPKYELRNNQILISSDGNITWIPHMIFRSSCSLDVLAFPFDRQKCALWFGSWTHTSREVDLDLASGGLDITTFQADFHESRMWDIVNHSSARVPPGSHEDYTVLLFTMTMERRLVFSGYILTLPCIFLAFLALVVFCLPPERPDRTGLGMSLFASFLFLLLILVETAPPTAASVPKLGLYYCFNMVIIMLSIFLSSLVVNVNKLGDGHTAMPRWIEVLAIDVLAKVFLVDSGNSQCCSKKNHNQLETSLNESSCSTHDLRNEKITHACSALPDKSLSETSATDGFGTLLRELQLHVSDMHHIMVKLMEKEDQKLKDSERFVKGGSKWRVLAAVLDRCFLLSYCIGIVWSLFVLFPWPEKLINH